MHLIFTRKDEKMLWQKAPKPFSQQISKSAGCFAMKKNDKALSTVF